MESKPAVAKRGARFLLAVYGALVLLFLATQAGCRKEASSTMPHDRATPVAPPALLETVGEFAVAPLRAEGFEALTPRERALAFYLHRAALAGRDIHYDQMGRHNLEIRDLLEEILTHPRGLDPAFRESLHQYLKLFWINSGNHNDRTKRKFVPGFTFDQLRAGAHQAAREGASIRMAIGESLDQKLRRLQPYLLDPAVEPLLTCKTPPPDQDLLSCSSVNYYEGVGLQDLRGFEERHPLNSTLVRKDGRLAEEVWRAGRTGQAGADVAAGRSAVPPGRYAPELRTVIGFLRKAAGFADPAQRALIGRLCDYFETGDPADFRAYNIDWVGMDPRVDTINGFIETYKDPRSRKGAWQGVVYLVDPVRTRMQKALAAEAQYFEDRAPWDDRFKRRGFNAPVATAAQVLLAVGDSGPMPPIGVNLPNDEDISERHGNRSFLLVNVIESGNRATEEKTTEAFAWPEDRALIDRHSAEAEMLMTAMHEILGHAAGKVDDSLRGEPSALLREHYATLEEARAELVALYHIFDPRLAAIGVVSSPGVAEAAYCEYAVQDLAQLRRVREGDRLEDDHMRATHLIVSWLRESGAIVEANRDGRTYYRVVDYGGMRQGVARLLAEVQRIKSEGDIQAAAGLLARFASRIDPRLRDEVVARAASAGIPSYVAYVMPEIVPVRNAAGEVIDARLTHPADLTLQMLRFSGKLPLEPSAEP